ncbi:hypothetical protein G647_01780 [Cladophialophora carrionii CBS 160.54]|uniref:Cytochrome P450 n=1 Tax=Cladophialophora carrionii CBS 160.54 TaxID=1279043 RepID=V9DTL3_9EURO|nr:uncharacterized protein G647_01780 [Cladophialophora carrionii CBS 160.54]ETI29327.1 hypothetical protein G647_01780 [Cladophialophora carrionii CBS 160.54]
MIPVTIDHLPFVLIALGVLLATYLLSLCTYRLYFSPVAHIPGPSLARITYWYEFYYDVLLKGQYTFKIKRLHDQYGPIIRINPHEVHIRDPDFYEVVYADDSRCKRDKWSWSCRQHGLPLSTLATVGHNHHRLRRGALDPFFSKARVQSLQPVLEDVARKLLARFEEFQMLGDPLPISLAFATLTNVDIAEQYVLGRNDKRALARDFDPSFYEASLTSSTTGYLTKHFPFITKLTQLVPDNLTILMKPATASYVKLRRDIKHQIEQIVRTEHRGDDNAKSDTSKPSSHQHTLIHEILRSDLSYAEKSPARVYQDVQATVTAGTLATASALSYTLFSLLSHPRLLQRLRTELHAAMPNPTVLPSLAVLEQLPFLTACIKEGLRLSIGASSRLQRIDPVNPIVFTADRTEGKSCTYVLPAGTPLSMTGLLVHFDRDTFPNPGAFDPDRWLGSSTPDRYLVAFSKGTRQCVGIHLAYAEMYIALALIFRIYGCSEVRMKGDRGYLELFETEAASDGDGNIDIVDAGGISSAHQKRSRDIRIKVGR